MDKTPPLRLSTLVRALLQPQLKRNQLLGKLPLAPTLTVPPLMVRTPPVGPLPTNTPPPLPMFTEAPALMVAVPEFVSPPTVNDWPLAVVSEPETTSTPSVTVTGPQLVSAPPEAILSVPPLTVVSPL